MTYVITNKCVGRKDASCVGVCPVDAINPTPGTPEFLTAEQLFIDPETCIDCDACFEECPVSAIYPEKSVPGDLREAIAQNNDYYA